MLTVLILAALACVAIGYALSVTPQPPYSLPGDMADRIDKLLPQTQCGACGYPGCRPYAEAIARGEAGINQCPPGGDRAIAALAALLGREPEPPNPAYGEYRPPRVAWIDEELCIGCVKCIHACPVDAIVGAPKQMHTVLAAECTGCELCVAPCPVDCIHMLPVPHTPIWTKPAPAAELRG
jgi:electron transport complex protein RnfB